MHLDQDVMYNLTYEGFPYYGKRLYLKDMKFHHIIIGFELLDSTLVRIC